MIELVSESRCINCNLCVSVCPTNVFESVPGKPPQIARQSDCQTCFICEVYCPVDALYVAPNPEASVTVSEAELVETQLLGSYRASIGWGSGRQKQAQQDQTFHLLKTMQTAAPAAKAKASGQS